MSRLSADRGRERGPGAARHVQPGHRDLRAAAAARAGPRPHPRQHPHPRAAQGRQGHRGRPRRGARHTTCRPPELVFEKMRNQEKNL